jgi:hypothetical protein
MTQIKKTYRNINPEMLYAEIQDLVTRQDIDSDDAKTNTYGLPSGATQSRITMILRAQNKECGSVHIIGSSEESRMLLNIDEQLISSDNIASLQENIDFLLDPYEVKW